MPKIVDLPVLSDLTGSELVILERGTTTGRADLREFIRSFLKNYQVAFRGDAPRVDPSKGMVRYPRMLVSRDGEAFRDVNPATHAGAVGGYFELPFQTGDSCDFHYLDLTALGGAGSPVKRTSGGAAPDLTVTTNVPLGWTLGGHYHCYWTDRIYRLDASDTPELALKSPVIDDRYGAFGGGPAVYIPLEGFFARSPAQGPSAPGLVTPTNADIGGPIAGHCKLALGSLGVINWVVYDFDGNQLRVVTYPALPGVPGGGAAGYRYACLGVLTGVWGLGAPTGVDWVQQGRNDKAEIYFDGPLIQDGSSLLVPPFYVLERDARVFDRREPAGGLSHFRIPLSPNRTTVARHVWDKAIFDATGDVNAAVRTVLAYENPMADGVKQTIFATSLGTRVNPKGHQLAGDVAGGNAPNMCLFGKDAEGLGRLYGGSSIGLTTNALLNNMGISQAVVDTTPENRPYGGMDFVERPRVGQRAFFRWYVEVSASGDFGTPGVFLAKEGGGSDFVTGQLLTAHSPTLREYIAQVEITRADYLYFWAGRDSSGSGATAKIAGLQYHCSGNPAWWIRRDDYPASGLSDFNALYPDHMFLIPGRPMPLYPDAITREKSDGDSHVVCFGTDQMTRPYARKAGREIIIAPEDIGSANGAIDFRPYVKTQRRDRLPVTIHVGADRVATTVRPLFIGDSITDYEGPLRAARVLEQVGYDVRCVGTMQNGGGGTNVAPLYPGEGREGREFADFIYAHTDAVSPIVPGEEAAYRAKSDVQKRSINPFLFAAAAGDIADYVRNGHIFSVAKYLVAQDLADPTHVIINLSRNDISQNDEATAMAQILEGFEIMYHQTRAALPEAHIGFVFIGEARSPIATHDWRRIRWAILKKLNQLIKAKRADGDSRLWLIPAYAHMSDQLGWRTAQVATDAETGRQTLDVDDTVHPLDLARAQQAEVTAAWIHCTHSGSVLADGPVDISTRSMLLETQQRFDDITGDIKDQIVEELTASFGDFDARMFLTPETGALDMAVGKFFYAIAPIGAVSPDDGHDIAGEKRLYQRTAVAPFYADQGDRAAPATSFPAQLKAAGKIESASVARVEQRYLIDPAATNAATLDRLGVTNFDDSRLYDENTPGWLQQTVRRRLGNKFDPFSNFYGAVAGLDTGDPEEDMRRAQRNRLAYAAAIADWMARLRNGDKSASLVMRDWDQLTCTAPTPMANWIISAEHGSYWSSHSIDINFGDDEVDGGIIECEGGLFKRIENDPGSKLTAYDANNSTVLIRGYSRGLSIVGLIRGEGFQVDSQSGGVRGKTSGDFIQVNDGVQGLDIEAVIGWKGTNAGVVFNLNKKGIGSTPAAGTSGYDTRPEKRCKWNNVRQVTTFNGEHGCADYGGYHNRFGLVDISQKAYTFGGVEQGSYQQRAFYGLNCDLDIDTLKVRGVNHVALFAVAYDESRTQGDCNIRVRNFDAEFPTSQDDDPDRYAAVECNNANNGVGVIRKINVSIENFRSRGHKTAFMLREGRRYVSLTDRVFGTFDIANWDAESILHGFYGKVNAGWDCVRINGKKMAVRSNPAISTTTVPADGLVLQAGGWYNRETAITVTMAEMAAFPYWDGVSNTAPYAYIKPGNIKKVTNWPGASGTVFVIYDPTRFSGADRWGFDQATGAPWKLLTEEPRKADFVDIGLAHVQSECATGRFAGIRLVNQRDTYYEHVDGLPLLPADKVPLERLGIDRFITDGATTSADVAISDPALARTATMKDVGTRQPASAALTAIGALVPAADRLPYFTSAGAALADFPAQARSLLAASTQAAQRLAMGLGDLSLQAPGAVALTGGSATLSSLALVTTAGSANLPISAPLGQSASLSLRKDMVELFRLECTSASSDVAMRYMNDAGVVAGTAYSIARATGVMNITSLTSANVTLSSTATTSLALVRSGASGNCSASYTTSAGTNYAGNVDGTSWAAGPSSNLLTNPYFRGSATQFTVPGLVSAGVGFQAGSFTLGTLPAPSLYPRTEIYCSDLGGGGGLLESDGIAWRRSKTSSYEARSTDAGAAFTFTYLVSADTQRLTVPIGANRTVALTPGAPSGVRARFTRDIASTGTSVWAIGTLKNLAPGSWCEIESDGAAWILVEAGSLS